VTDRTQPLDRIAQRLVRSLVPAPARRFVLRRIRLLLYRGERVECPCCGGRFSRFMPGLSHRAVRVCPRCGAQERHRALWLYLRERTDLLERDISILHWAPEYALQRSLSRLPNAFYVSADLDGDEAMQHMDITDVPFKDDAFDLIVCVHVLEHIPDDRRALAEITRVLRPGGRLLLLDHVRGSARIVRAVQWLLERLTLRLEGDHLLRRPIEHVRALGLRVERDERSKLGVVERVAARKPEAI